MPKKVTKKVAKATVKKVTAKKAATKSAAKSAKTPLKKAAKKAAKKGTGGYVCQIVKNDPTRENRIDMEIVVDAYDPVERMIGWVCSIEEVLNNNVRCRCRKTRSMSPLKVGEEVDVLTVASEDDCKGEMFVFVRWNNRQLAVPLEQLEPISGNPKAVEIVEDWLYWCLMGYGF